MKRTILLLLTLTCILKLPAQLSFENKAAHTIWVAVAYASKASGTQSWYTEGWYKVEPGNSVTVLSNPLRYRTYYYYAVDADKNVWVGDTELLVNPNDKFTIRSPGHAASKTSSRKWRKFKEMNVGEAMSFTQSLTTTDRCLSGDCENGYGKYKWFGTSKVYEGQWRNGSRNGKGTATYGKFHSKRSGDSYSGEWKNNDYHGQGTYTWANDLKTYTGSWVSGNRHGHGTTTYGGNHTYSGGKYSGNWVEDHYEGEGTFTAADGSKFVGQWKNDKKHGMGILYDASGREIKAGRWANDEWVEGASQPEIAWTQPLKSAHTSEARYTVSACVTTPATLESVELLVNGKNVYSAAKAFKPVPNNGCDYNFSRTIPLEMGQNKVVLKVRNKWGAVSSTPVFIEYRSGNSPALAGEKRVALLVGNGDYSHTTSLRNPVNDVSALESKLKRFGFEVIKYENLEKDEMNRAVHDFGHTLREADIGLFYYSGHGVNVEGSNYLIPTDSRLTYEEDTPYECVDVGSVLAKMEGAGSSANIVILDACRNNPFKKSWNRSSKSEGLSGISAPVGTIIAYATAPGETASDGMGTHSTYTSELLAALDQPNMKIEEVFKQVRIAVMSKSGSAQIPWESSSLIGDVILNEQ